MRILYNARIYTQDSAQPVVSALAVDQGKVIAAGWDEDILSLAAADTEKEDLQGRTVWPGLTDAHVHLEFYSGFLAMIDCETGTKEECLRRVAERAQRAPEGAWVLGHGWNQNVWAGGFGTAAELDAVSYGHPVYLTSKSLHSAWANNLALQKAGIGANTPNPQGGVIGRDASGKADGILFESAADLVANVIPESSEAELANAIERAQQTLYQYGLTGVHDFDRRRCFQALQMLEQEGRLGLRVIKNLPVELLTEAAAVGLRSGFGSDHLRIGSIKMFADGALGPRTAAMLQPYEGESSYTGIPLLDAEEVFERGQEAAGSGLSLTIHAIGDRANHEVIDGYRQLRDYETQKGLPHLRHRIEHVQLLHPEDAPRLAQLDIIASMQPIHATSDMEIADRHWGSRSSGAYAWRTLLERSTHLAFGSDAPVESPNPFLGLHAAVTRARPGSAEGWYPEQRLRLEEALAAFTTGPAYAAGMENRLGRLAPGYYADLILLESDPFSMPAGDLYRVQPLATMIGGEWVYQAS